MSTDSSPPVVRTCLEGIVGKWARGRYHVDGITTAWVKIKNPDYSQMAGRRALFERRRDLYRADRIGRRAPVLDIGHPAHSDARVLRDSAR